MFKNYPVGYEPLYWLWLILCFSLSVYSNSHNFRNNDRMELILVPNDAEFPLVFKNTLKSAQKHFDWEVIAMIYNLHDFQTYVISN